VRLLLDTHAVLWWFQNSPDLSAPALNAISDTANEIFVSAASAWEIATKHRIGKLPVLAPALVANMEALLHGEGFTPLPVSVRHGQQAGALSGSHKDPFDRVLIAQALIEGMALVSNERLFDAYGVGRLW
jgi:PIN domain nuclease of toxin-antitoxin system